MMRKKKQIRQASEEIIQEIVAYKRGNLKEQTGLRVEDLNSVPESATVALGGLLTLSGFLVVIRHLRWISKFSCIF